MVLLTSVILGGRIVMYVYDHTSKLELLLVRVGERFQMTRARR